MNYFVIRNTSNISNISIHLRYQFVNAFLDRTGELGLIFEIGFFHEEVPWNIWLRLILEWAMYFLELSVFLFEAFSCMKNVDHEWKKLNMNSNNIRIRLVMKWRLNCRKILILFAKFIFWKKMGFNFLADWRTICLKFVKMFEKKITKELSVRASFKFLNDVGYWSWLT